MPACLQQVALQLSSRWLCFRVGAESRIVLYIRLSIKEGGRFPDYFLFVELGVKEAGYSLVLVPLVSPRPSNELRKG